MKELVEFFAEHFSRIPSEHSSEVDGDMSHKRVISQEKYLVSVQRIRRKGFNEEPSTKPPSRSKSCVIREMDDSVLQLLTWEVDWSSLPPYAAKHFAAARSIFIETLISTELKKACTLHKVHFFVYSFLYEITQTFRES